MTTEPDPPPEQERNAELARSIRRAVWAGVRVRVRVRMRVRAKIRVGVRVRVRVALALVGGQA